VRLVTIAGADGPRLGVLEGDEVVDVGGAEPTLPRDAAGYFAAGAEPAVRRALAWAPRLPRDTTALGPPVLRPPKFLGIGLNYAGHVAESGQERPAHQLWFNKQSTCVVGPGQPILIPTVSEMVDYEGELGVVIGRRARHVPVSRAAEVIGGFTVVNDVSVRDWQWRVPTWTLGKSFDTHGPLGPAVVTADEVEDPHALGLRTWVNGDLRQDARTDDLIFDCYEMVAHLSTVFTLEPGDVLATGTPAGVGFARQPPAWLKAGDTVRIEIEHVGVLENPVDDEQLPAG
jgi:2-keto-4-pentenoate hydratase/2-oxohepta-3-ene-1,7-dioic acid hydratase in catechol pathway